jgi:hypothetical protein
VSKVTILPTIRTILLLNTLIINLISVRKSAYTSFGKKEIIVLATDKTNRQLAIFLYFLYSGVI